MEIQFQKSKLGYLHPSLREVKNQEQTQEIKLSDGMPDIGRVLSAWGQPILRSKEWRSDAIAFSGGVMVWVLYAPEDGSAPRCLESWIPFQMRWDLNDQSREGDIRIRCLLRFVDARSVSARKMIVRAGVGAIGEAFVQENAEIGVPGELPEDVQLLNASYPIRLPKAAGEKTFLMDEELTLPGSCPLPEKLIYYTMEPRVSEQKVMSNKVVFRGSGNLHILYTSEEGQLHSWDFELPFSQFADLENMHSADAQADVQMCITSLELELDDESHLRLKCGLLGQYVISDREMIQLVEDAYSPSRQVTLEQENLELPAILETRQERMHPQQSIAKDANLVVDANFLPDFPRQRRNGEGIQLEMPGQFQTLFYADDGSLQSGSARWEGVFQLAADENSRVDASVLSAARPQAMAGNNSIQLNGEMDLQLESWAEQAIPMVTGLEMAQPNEADSSRPSVILRRAGDARLWDIAKSTGSTVAAIKAANNLEGEPAVNQVLLIPVS